MRNTLLATVAFTFVGFGAHAGNLSALGLDDPEVTAPECRILFGLLPCHAGFEYVEPEGDDHVPSGRPDDNDDGDDDNDDDRDNDNCDDDSDGSGGPDPDDEVKDKKDKSDNSDANGKGGNKHDRDDHTDNGTETAEDKKGV